MRREFSANVSHELKTPLQSILGYAEIMKNGLVKDEDKQRFLERIHAEAENMIELIQQIMELSRLDENKSVGDFVDVDLYAMAQNIAARLKYKADKRGITLDVAGSNAVVCGVQSVLSEVVYNLVDNAIKYNKDNGSVSVKVTDGADEVTVSVSDTGIGIGAADRERVLNAFTARIRATTRKPAVRALGFPSLNTACFIIKGAWIWRASWAKVQP